MQSLHKFLSKKQKILKIITISIIIVFPIRYFLIQPFIIEGSSMEPSFKNGDYIIIDKISYLFKKPKRGEIIIFKMPSKKIFIKRTIGLPSETIQIKNGDIFVYSKNKDQWIKLAEKYILPNTKNFPEMKIVLNDNEYFVLGDNREESADSRSFGAVSSKNIVGRFFIKLWPLIR